MYVKWYTGRHVSSFVLLILALAAHDRFSNVEAENEDVAFSLSAPASSIRPESRPPTDTSVDGGGDESATSFEETNVNSASTAKGDLPKDPLRWFGILVPPALRQAQSAFASAVEGPIPEIATLAKDLRRQEVDIARLRKLIKKM
ncbi:hypothetical protein EJ04DRAFT_507343 [Polyplosphaeria fusca]|uniref:Vacuolar ATPase assembly protein VMA22 n=1 Tax=Polyplosphaeria fusca TaxID=682080 RepID=A0A9P4RB83_9PLEO|nr:hypothetical protein EJ04DRAFT_507343 [Polyplosphaeria fusca]